MRINTAENIGVPPLRRSRATRHPIFRRIQPTAAVDPIMEDDENEDSDEDDDIFGPDRDEPAHIPPQSASIAIS